MAKTEFDVCVIGTGAGGGVMIDQLTAAGLQVVALERGGELSMADFDDDELRNPIRDQIFSPHQLETWRPDEATPTQTGRFSQIAHCVGGTLTHWAAWSWRFRPDEFRVLPAEGPVAGASLADWPIGYDEMEPFYEKAEWEFGVSGTGDANPFAGPRKKGFPNPAHPERVTGQVFARGAKKLGYSPFPVPMAINSRAYAGRPRCMYGGACRSYGCPIHAKGTTFSISLPRARATGNLDLRPGAMVVGLPMKDGRVVGARYLDAAGTIHEVRARQVILAAGTVGTPHLLLLSSSGEFPQGLANGSGLVGKNLQFHHHPGAVGVFDDDLRAYTGFETHTAIDDLHASDAKRGFIRGGVVAELNTFTHRLLAGARARPARGRAFLGRDAQTTAPAIPANTGAGRHLRGAADGRQPGRSRPGRERPLRPARPALHQTPASERSGNVPLVREEAGRDRRSRGRKAGRDAHPRPLHRREHPSEGQRPQPRNMPDGR
ncbi:MAG: hypothetical protein GY937_17205 [bacterium]|nr:hypothetical protein [bacterium]